MAEQVHDDADDFGAAIRLFDEALFAAFGEVKAQGVAAQVWDAGSSSKVLNDALYGASGQPRRGFAVKERRVVIAAEFNPGRQGFACNIVERDLAFFLAFAMADEYEATAFVEGDIGFVELVDFIDAQTGFEHDADRRAFADGIAIFKNGDRSADIAFEHFVQAVIFGVSEAAVHVGALDVSLLSDAIHGVGVDPGAQDAERPVTRVPRGGFEAGFFEYVMAILRDGVMGDGMRVEGLVELGFVPGGEEVEMLPRERDTALP